jgi:anti-sigma factor RsiW
VPPGRFLRISVASATLLVATGAYAASLPFADAGRDSLSAAPAPPVGMAVDRGDSGPALLRRMAVPAPRPGRRPVNSRGDDGHAYPAPAEVLDNLVLHGVVITEELAKAAGAIGEVIGGDLMPAAVGDIELSGSALLHRWSRKQRRSAVVVRPLAAAPTAVVPLPSWLIASALPVLLVLRRRRQASSR